MNVQYSWKQFLLPNDFPKIVCWENWFVIVAWLNIIINFRVFLRIYLPLPYLVLVVFHAIYSKWAADRLPPVECRSGIIPLLHQAHYSGNFEEFWKNVLQHTHLKLQLQFSFILNVNLIGGRGM